MWIKHENRRYNLNNVKRYSHDLATVYDHNFYLQFQGESIEIHLKRITGKMLVEYIDNLIEAGENKDTLILEINDELEKKIENLNVKFKTLEEFKE